jgi:SOS-response transcriptional repressor LexA
MTCIENDMQSIGDKIKKIRTSMGMVQKDFGVKICELAEDGAQQKISSYEVDGVNPPYQMLRILADKINVSVDDLIDNNIELPDEIEASLRAEKSHKAPLISWVQAGGFSPAVDMFIPGEGEEYLEIISNDPNAFALRIKGHSMEPDFKPGDIIIISPNKQPESGNLVVAKLKWEGEATFKRLILSNDSVILRPLNPDYPEIIINGADRENVRIVGVVIEMRRRDFK